MGTGSSATQLAWKPQTCENVPNIEHRTLHSAAQLGIKALVLPGRIADPDGLGYWTEASYHTGAVRLLEFDLAVGIMVLHNVTPRVILGQSGCDEDIENVIRSIRAAAAAGYRAIEYNFYNHRASEVY